MYHPSHPLPKPPKLSEADRLRRAVDGANPVRDDAGLNYVAFPFGSGHRVFALDSSDLLNYLSHNFETNHRISPSPHAVRGCALGFRAHASKTWRPVALHSLYCPARGSGPDALYINLDNVKAQYIHISPDKWSVTVTEDAHLLYDPDAYELPIPVRAPEPALPKLRAALGLESGEPATGTRLWHRCLAWLTCAFAQAVQRPSYPILALTGTPFASTRAAQILRFMIAPVEPLTRPMPDTPKQLLVHARYNYVCAFEPRPELRPIQIETLCRIASGTTLYVHERYGDGRPLSVPIRRPILLPIPSRETLSHPGLAARSLHVHIPAGPLTDCGDNDALLERLETFRRGVLAELCDAAQCAMKRLKSEEVQSFAARATANGVSPHLLHAAVWTFAAAPALGLTEAGILDAFAPEPPASPVDPIIGPLQQLTQDGNTWTGTATGLVAALNSPLSPRALSERLRRLGSQLDAAAISVTSTRTSRSRTLTIETIPASFSSPTSVAPTTSSPPPVAPSVAQTPGLPPRPSCRRLSSTEPQIPVRKHYNPESVTLSLPLLKWFHRLEPMRDILSVRRVLPAAIASMALTLLARAQDFRLETRALSSGAELITVFGASNPNSGSTSGSTSGAAPSEVPVLAVLKDTLGDSNPANDRLRQLWVLPNSRRSVGQRITAFIPFLYRRTPFGRAPKPVDPKPLIDFSATRGPRWAGLLREGAQLFWFDGHGAAVRASTRAYQRNSTDFRTLHTARALSVLSQLEETPQAQNLFSPSELREMQARLSLDGRLLGGLVSESKLTTIYENRKRAAAGDRARNWELLRQRAESNGLYFQPAGGHALLWIARTEIDRSPAPRFNARFLNIRDPFRDSSLREWKGYTEAWQLAAGPSEMLPLAFYSLDHPRVPLLLADFRSAGSPRRREVRQRAFSDVTHGLMGLSKWGNWQFFAGHSLWSFVTHRRGAPLDRYARVSAFGSLRDFLATDESLNPALRSELERRVRHLIVNPLEDPLGAQARAARAQYQALVARTESRQGLNAMIYRDRRAELVPAVHSRTARFFLRAGRIATFGLYQHREKSDETLIARVDRERQIAYHTRFLHDVLAAGPLPEVAWDMDVVRASLRQLASLGASTHVIASLYNQTWDEPTRRDCLALLEQVNRPALTAAGGGAQ